MQLIIFLALINSSTGVIIIDNVWFYGNDGKSRILTTGDSVEITGKEGELAKVNFDNTIGTLHRDVLIDLSERIAEDRLLVFARGYYDENEYKKSMKLFDIFIEYFNVSNYLSEALYYDGLSYEELAKHYNKSDSLQHLWYNSQDNSWCYDGSAYQIIIKQYPKSVYAPKAQYRLIRIFRMQKMPWHDSIPIINEEIKMWQAFADKYKKCAEYASALLEIGYLNRVLFQITKDFKYQHEAKKIFQGILRNHGNSIYSAQAKVNLYEIDNNIEVYYY